MIRETLMEILVFKYQTCIFKSNFTFLSMGLDIKKKQIDLCTIHIETSNNKTNIFALPLFF